MNVKSSSHSLDSLQEVKVMPNIKSAIKRVKTSESRNAQNTMAKSAMRTAVKKVEAAVTLNDAAAAKEALVVAASKLDKAAAKGLIHKNAAARKKARLMKKINAL
jgi:small subunit ribosomal protein S20